MAIQLAFFNDAAMTSVVSSLPISQAADGSAPAVDRVVYLGSPVSGNKYQAASDPGVAQITVSIADAATSSGVAASAVKLALSAGALDTATAGAALDVGAQILSGAGNAVAVYVRVDTPAMAAGLYTDLSLITNTVLEVAQ